MRRFRDDRPAHDLAVFNNFDVMAGLPDDGARIAADKRVTAQMFAALDRFKQKRLTLAAYLVIGGERRFKIREDAARDRNQVSLLRQLQKRFQCW